MNGEYNAYMKYELIVYASIHYIVLKMTTRIYTCSRNYLINLIARAPMDDLVYCLLINLLYYSVSDGYAML